MWNIGTGKAALLATMCLAVLLAQVDTSVVNLATHSIRADLGASVVGLQWVLDAYNLTYALLLLTGGLLSDLYGRRRLFLLGAAVFTVGSVVCAAAPWVALLIFGRAITGAGAALLLPASLSIIRVEWQDEQARNRALGIWAACNGLAFVIGPTIGGALVDAFGWRSLFLIAVPLGGAAIGVGLRVIPESRDPADRRLDLIGQLCGAYEGPHDCDVELQEIMPILRKLNVGGFVLPFANPRHAHEYAVLRDFPLDPDQVIVAGVIDSVTNFVEHPKTIAERIERVAEAVGDPKRVLAGTDCGFDTSAGQRRVAEDIVWAKLAALSEGARIASQRLF